MKIKNLLFVAFAFAGILSVSAQSNLLNAKTPDEIGKKTPAQMISDNDKPLPYGYVHDRDVLMGKTIWEIIDIDERINFPLYYPIDTAFVGKDRRSLFDVLVKNIKNGKITEVYADDYFNTKRAMKDMESSFVYIDTIQAGFDEINNYYDDYKSGKKVLDPQFINKQDLTAQDISGWKIKGFWYFDKRQSELKYRLLALCPVTPEARDIGKDNPDVIDLFWVYFPAIRDILHEAKAFNDKNSAMPITFDHLLNSRRFNAVIYKEENVYGDREVQQYMKDNAQMQLLESERIKEKIRSFESDMWNY
ncbi:type IX secretion system ring subunit PorN/GldN [Flavobacterium capsici]|uniref:Gliding motility protein GldN n=1 Tax=Flavobacterium capsici TaxID=3075618 RepID=A0AA96J4H8_9FLAO|nr:MULTISPECIES: gliding motility protein GldN [unclassified Flavobacterium]WNM19144.1 gliding motility protein GldN [Flavobacterium sp. PMR2A8]WNM20533.1 gliding motility protein GldN [Flavobacterium sp. PMTSA4]